MAKKQMSSLWITDPWHTLDHPNDTTLRLIQEGINIGVSQYWCDVKSIRYEDLKVVADVKKVLEVQSKRDSNSFIWADPETCDPANFPQIHYRPDPPVDLAYLHPLQLLRLALEKSPGRIFTQMVNPFGVLFSLNEKLEASQLIELMPKSHVSSQWESLSAFGHKQGRTVLKPLHLAQSLGIELLDWRSKEGADHAKQKLNEATLGFQVPVLLQVYLEGISEGETRLWFVDGKLIAWVKKLPLNGDFRVNMDRGSQLEKTNLTAAEKKRASKISDHLKARKIRLAAVDLIENYVTDFNFTSPGLITQMESVLRENLARQIVKSLSTID